MHRRAECSRIRVNARRVKSRGEREPGKARLFSRAPSTRGGEDLGAEGANERRSPPWNVGPTHLSNFTHVSELHSSRSPWQGHGA